MKQEMKIFVVDGYQEKAVADVNGMYYLQSLETSMSFIMIFARIEMCWENASGAMAAMLKWIYLPRLVRQ